jgi:hypothetical protein
MTEFPTQAAERTPAQMRAVSMTQPWASLVGDKRIETRSWRTSYRGPLLIHASKGFPVTERMLCWQDPFFRCLLAILGMTDKGQSGEEIAMRLPVGALVSVCNLVDCRRMASSEDNPFFDEEREFDISPAGSLTEQERAFGLYEVGRYAWILEDVRRLPEPIYCKGALQLWTPPVDVRDKLPTLHLVSDEFTEVPLRAAW